MGTADGTPLYSPLPACADGVMINIKEGQAGWSVMDFVKMAAVTFAIVATSATSGALAALAVVPKMEGTASLKADLAAVKMAFAKIDSNVTKGQLKNLAPE